MYCARHLCPILTRTGVFRHSLAEAPSVKFYEKRPVDAALIRATDMTKPLGSFCRLCERT